MAVSSRPGCRGRDAVFSRPVVRGASRGALLPPAEENRLCDSAETAPGPRKTAGAWQCRNRTRDEENRRGMAVPDKLITGAGVGNGSKFFPLPALESVFLAKPEI